MKKKSHHQKPKKKQAAQIHALIKRTYIFQKVGISVLNRINSDILQFIFIIRMSLLCVWLWACERHRISSVIFPFRDCRASILFISFARDVFFFSLAAVFSIFDVWIYCLFGNSFALCTSILAGIIIIFPFGKFDWWLMESLNHLHYKRSTQTDK